MFSIYTKIQITLYIVQTHPSHPFLCWRKKEGDKNIEFGDIPFATNGETLQLSVWSLDRKSAKNLRLPDCKDGHKKLHPFIAQKVFEFV